LWVATAVCVATVAAAGEPAAAPRLEAPRASDLSLAQGIVDRTLTPAAAARIASYWGGSFQTSTSEEVTIKVSDAYPQDPAIAQRWATFLGSLVHGPELSSVTVYVAPPDEVERRCGDGALACYSPGQQLVVTPGEDPTRRISAEAVLAHEYGHHVAANRVNPPFGPTIDWGTKRWASAEQVCARERAGELSPGAEDPIRYPFNPGEGFAESYRLLNERVSGRAETPWLIVDGSLYPSPQALELLRQDVVSPWRANRVSTIRGAFTKAGPRRRTYSSTAAFDGSFEATLRTTGRARLSLAVLNPAGRTVARTRATSGSATARTIVCGTRSFRLQVTHVSGAGRFQLSVSRP
jgi:hypothetical protein